MTDPAPQVLVAGAGPTGLAAALFLLQRGVALRILDKAPQPATTSKALAVNPRTLELLETTGVSARIRAEGRPVSLMSLRRNGRPVLTLNLARDSPAEAMVVLPQARTEALLTEALTERGVILERGVDLAFDGQDASGVRARLRHPDGREEVATAPLLLAADGAHSSVRHAIGVGFPGAALPETWELADVVYTAPLDGPEGFVDLKPGGFVFAMAFDAERTTWRFIATVGDPTTAGGPDAPPIQSVAWRSSFRISHRIADRLAVGRTALAGDAAHLHSPMGARGMNLGIEDAWVYAACAADALAAGAPDRIAAYGRLRHEVDAAVVHRIALMTEVVRGHGAMAAVRRLAPRLAGRVPALRRRFVQIATGLDHPVRTA